MALEAVQSLIIQTQQGAVGDQQIRRNTAVSCNVMVINPPQHQTTIQTETIACMQ